MTSFKLINFPFLKLNSDLIDAGIFLFLTIFKRLEARYERDRSASRINLKSKFLKSPCKAKLNSAAPSKSTLNKFFII